MTPIVELRNATKAYRGIPAVKDMSFTLHRGEVLHMLQRLGVPDLPDGDPQEWEHLTGRV